MEIIKLTAYFIIIIHLYCIKNIANQQVNESERKLITNCILKVLENIFFYRPTILIVKDAVGLPDQEFFLDNIKKKFNDHNVPHVIYDLDKIDMNHLLKIFDRRLLVVIYADTCYLNRINRNIIISNVKYLIITNTKMNRKCAYEFQKFGFETSFQDITYIVKNNIENHYDLISFLPEIDSATCEPDKQINSSHIHTCVDGNDMLKTKTVFPAKYPRDFHKCPLKVGMGNIFPYSIIDNFTKLSTYDPLDKKDVKGSNFEILKIFAERYNITLQLFFNHPFMNEEFSEFIKNGSLDMGAVGLSREYGDEFDYSGIYSINNIVWIYRAERIKQNWKVLASKLNGVYIFFLFYICYSIIWYILCQFDKEAVSFSKILICGFGALVGATSLSDARSAKQKILNLAYLLLCIHLSAFISIQFYSFLTIQGPPTMFKTVEEIMDSDKTPYFIPYLKNSNQDVKYLMFTNASKECRDYDDCEKKVFFNDGVTLLPDHEFYTIQIQETEVEEVGIIKVPEAMMMLYHEMTIKKNSSIVLNLQKFVARLFEAGINERLYKEAIGILRIYKKDIAHKMLMENSYKCQSGCPITLTQIAGAFYLWIFGCVLAFCVFVLEVLFKLYFTLKL